MKARLSQGARFFDDKTILKKATDAARKAVLWTARDVRSAAKRSIKSGGKNPLTASYKTSKPGEPPRSHKGTLKNAIVYEKLNEDSYLVGAPRLGNSQALKVLEYGGQAKSNRVYYTEEYATRATKRLSRRKTKVSAPTTRPRAARPYTIYAKSGTRTIVRDYRKFTSRQAWENAVKSARFLSWAKRQRVIENATYKMAARPYMKPSLLVAASPEKVAQRLRRAANLR